MAELKVLGAQRIKALTEVLESQKEQAIKNACLPTSDDVWAMVDEEFGLTEHRKLLEQLEAEVERIKADIDETTGEFSYRYGRKELAYNKRKEELKRDLIDAPTAAISKEYDEKARALWLCETLEDAKKIVYGEEK